MTKHTRLLAAVLVTAAAILASGCSSSDSPTDFSAEEVTAPTAAEEVETVEEPAPTFADSWGGNGEPWSLDSSCPELAVVAGLLNLPGLEMNGTDTIGGCRYFDLAVPAAISIFSQTQADFDATPFDPAFPHVGAPSLGPAAFTVVDARLGACGIYTSRSDESDYVLVVTAVSQKSDDERCNDAVSVLQAVGTQG